MGRRENLAARSFSAGCGRDTASRAPPRVCAPKDQRNARRVLFTNGGKTNAPDFARTVLRSSQRQSRYHPLPLRDASSPP